MKVESTEKPDANNGPGAKLVAGFMVLLFVFFVFSCFENHRRFDQRMEVRVTNQGGFVKRKSNASRPDRLHVFDSWRYPVEEIDLTGCNVSDGDMPDLELLIAKSGCYLKILHLDRNPGITDKSIELLDKIHGLETVTVRGTSVTAAGIRSFDADPRVKLDRGIASILVALVVMAVMASRTIQSLPP